MGGTDDRENVRRRSRLHRHNVDFREKVPGEEHQQTFAVAPATGEGRGGGADATTAAVMELIARLACRPQPGQCLERPQQRKSNTAYCSVVRCTSESTSLSLQG